MRYTRLGRRGPRISVVGVGLWQAGSRLWGGRRPETLAEIKRGVELAIQHGINFFDTAEIYGAGLSERLLGEAIRPHRGEAVIATKIAGHRWTWWDIRRAAEASRRRLGTTPDLVQHHWPPPVYAPLCRLARNLEKLIDAGLAHHIGLSNYPARLLEKILECMKRHEPVSNQVQYSLAYRSPENRLKPLMEEKGMTLIAWSPLAKGALAGLQHPKTLAQRLDPVFRAAARDKRLQETLARIAERRGATKAEVALAWLVAKGAVPIPGFRRASRIPSIARAAELSLTEDDIRELDEASAEYVTRWGREYRSLQFYRYVPGLLQKLALLLGA